MQSSVLLLGFFVIWVYLLTVFKRKKLNFFFFLVGSIGMFLLLFFSLQPVLTPYLSRFVCWIAGLVGNLFGIFKAYTSYSILFIENQNGPVSLYVDFECAGLIEMLVFISLITFFDVYTVKQKILVSLEGIAWIMFANVVRLFSICCIIHFFGNESYYLAHTIVGRLVFYGMTIWFYFHTFTKAQILRQKVGEFDYAASPGK